MGKICRRFVSNRRNVLDMDNRRHLAYAVVYGIKKEPWIGTGLLGH